MTEVAGASQALVTTITVALSTASYELFHIAEDAVFYVTKEVDSWILDSGCSHHFSGNRQDFISYWESSGITMTAVNSGQLCVVSRGAVSIRVALPSDGESPASISDIVLTDVYFMLETGNCRFICLPQLMTSPH